MYNLCPVCGGYIGTAILYATTASTATVSPISFCPGHSTTDADLREHFHIMCTGVGPELVTLPPGSQIVSNHDEALWQIVKEVAETDSTADGEEDIHGLPINHFCPFCGNEQAHTDRVAGKEFLHHQSCIVTKARELMEWRKNIC